MRRQKPWVVVLANVCDEPLRAALDRALALAPCTRIVVVANAELAARVHEQLAGLGVDLVVQPRDLGTAPAALLASARIGVHDPDAHVVIMPADQTVSDPGRFVEAICQSARVAARGHDRVAVLGAIPDRPGDDLAWIVPGHALSTVSGRGAWTIARFVNRPGAALAARLWAGGGLWNTGVLAIKIAALWALADRHLPVHAQLFARYRAVLGTAAAGATLAQIYRSGVDADLTAELLQHAPRLAVVRLDGIAWSDRRVAALHLGSPAPMLSTG